MWELPPPLSLLDSGASSPAFLTVRLVPGRAFCPTPGISVLLWPIRPAGLYRVSEEMRTGTASTLLGKCCQVQIMRSLSKAG